MATTKMSAETIDLIKQMYSAGATYGAIGTAAHCGMGTIANVVKAAGLPPRGKARPKPFTPEQIEAIANAAPKTVEPDLSYLGQPAPKAKAAKKPAPRKPASKGKRVPAVKHQKRAIKHPTLKVGTTIKKLDRDGKVRARCTVVKDGIRYAGKTYPSISSAAMAAMKKLGLKSKAVNGYVWWGIAK